MNIGNGLELPYSFVMRTNEIWSRYLTARHGVQLFADVNITLHIAPE